MPFDLSTAKPVGGGFDLSTAKPVQETPDDVLSRIPGMDESIVPAEPPTGPTASERAIGTGEAALTLGTGMTGGAIGMLGGFLNSLAKEMVSGEFGTPAAANRIEEEAMKASQALTYEPRTEEGKAAVETAGNVLEPMAGLVPLTGELSALGASGQMAKTLPKRSEILGETIKSAEQSGIKPMTTDIIPPQTFTGKVGQAITERVPIVGTGGMRATQQASRTDAIKGFLADYGAVETAQAIDDVTANLLAKRSSMLDKYTTMKSDVIGRLSGKGAVDVSKTVSKIDAEISKLQGLKTESVKPAISVFEDFKSAIQNQDLGNIELLRRQLGEQLKDPGLASVRDAAEKASSRIYGTLREDMGGFIKNTGERNDYMKWSVANKRLKDMMGELNNTAIKSVLQTGEATPENARKLLFSRKPSEIRLLYKNLTPEGRRSARIAIMQEALDKVGGIEKLTPENFRRKIGQLSKSTGIFFEGADKKALDGLINALDLTRHSGTAGIKPITGAEVTTFAAPTAATYLLGGDPITGLAATASIGLLGRAFESAPVRNALIKLSNAPRNKWAEIMPELTAAVQPFIQSENQ